MHNAIALNQLAVWIFAGLLGYAAWVDWRSYTIPNRITLALLALYPVFALTADPQVSVLPAIALALATFGCGAVLFAMGGVGGGDVKLLAVVALWAGPAVFFDVLLVTTLAGGVLAVAYWAHRRATSVVKPDMTIGKSLAHWLMTPVVDWMSFAGSRAAGASGAASTTVDQAPAQERQFLPYGIAIFVGGIYLASTMLGR